MADRRGAVSGSRHRPFAGDRGQSVAAFDREAPAGDLLVDAGPALTDFAGGGVEQKVAAGIDPERVRASVREGDGARIGAGPHDEVVLQELPAAAGRLRVGRTRGI